MIIVEFISDNFIPCNKFISGSTSLKFSNHYINSNRIVRCFGGYRVRLCKCGKGNKQLKQENATFKIVWFCHHFNSIMLDLPRIHMLEFKIKRYYSKIGGNTYLVKFNWGIGRTYYWVCFS